MSSALTGASLFIKEIAMWMRKSLALVLIPIYRQAGAEAEAEAQ